MQRLIKIYRAVLAKLGDDWMALSIEGMVLSSFALQEDLPLEAAIWFEGHWA